MVQGMAGYKRSSEEESMLGKENGAKFDEGKNRYDLIAMFSLTELARNYGEYAIINDSVDGYYNNALFMHDVFGEVKLIL